MAMISCSECGREISDKAATCLGCGAPVSVDAAEAPPEAIDAVRYLAEVDAFEGTMVLMVKLAMRAVQQLGWKIDQANESLGLVTFQTGMSWGSFSGISGSLNIEPAGPNRFKVTGTGKQNVAGGQFFAVNLGGEAQGKAKKAIEAMKRLAA